MLSQAKRLEFVIIAATLLVLLFCRRPPRSGNAGVTVDAEPVGQRAPSAFPPPDPMLVNPLSDDLKPDPVTVEAPRSPDVSADLQRQARSKRVGVVDARNCRSLDYDDVMYGEVSVRWVWDGTKLVPHKVCVVEESNGVSSVWSFDQQADAVLSEVQETPLPHR